jgi:predicted Zn-dependent peptidase
LSGNSHFFEHTLSNGLRVVVESMPHVQSAAGGFLVRTGARDETPAIAGASHFLEHMCFKGTAGRDWREITVGFDKLGGDYNAYTSKERTVYYGWVRAEDIEPQFDLIADMMRSVLPPEEFEMERQVILEEIAKYNDNLESRIVDLIHELIYPEHSLSWPVLGTAETVGALSRDRVHLYLQDHYQPSNMVLIAAGNVDPKAVVAMAERLCGAWERKPDRADRSPPSAHTQTMRKATHDRFQQQAIALVFPAPSGRDPTRETGDVLAAILAGPNSRFFWNIIQAGITPQAWAGRLDYADVGMMIALGMCEPDKAEQVLEAMRGELDKLTTGGVTDAEVQRVKNRVRTGLATEAESPYYRFNQLVDDIDVLGRPREVSERLAAIEAVTPSGIRNYLEAWPVTPNVEALASAGPRDWPNNGK